MITHLIVQATRKLKHCTFIKSLGKLNVPQLGKSQSQLKKKLNRRKEKQINQNS